MRDPIADKAKQDAAIKEAQYFLLSLRRVTWGGPNNDLRLEFEAAVDRISALLQAIQRQALSQEDIRSWAETTLKHVVPVLRRGGRPPKRRQPGKVGRPTGSSRDRLIAEAVNLTSLCGFTATLNPGTTEKTGKKSASWIVSQALKNLGIKLSEPRVAAIWVSYKHPVIGN
jgi:hypothetical protein